MKVQELLEKITSEENYKEELITRNYIPFTEKVEIIDNILDSILYDDNGLTVYDTNELEMNKIIEFIKAYTTLEFENGITDYDLYMENMLGKYVVECIGRDYYSINEMLNNKLRDIEKQNNSLEAIVNKKVGVVIDTLIDSINVLNMKLNDTDTKSLKNALSTGIKDVLGMSLKG